ncbi:hypothetical protein ACFQY0_02055 [Haloferula chungangensis]|uniref:Uncharacterized protein n=1 Tax=Haloferula chungangensis TaxID=1048331 RepID=A0ABW2L0S7_9BACT
MFSSIANAQRTCRILFVGDRKDAPQEVTLFDGKGFQKVELPTMNLSPVYEVAAGEVSLRLLKEQVESPELIPSGAPGAKLSESAGDFYLLVSNDPANKLLPLSMKVVDADFSRFRMGEMLWFNLTNNRIGGKLGDEKLDLKPNSRLISKAPTDKAGNFPVELYYQRPGDKDVWPLCETKWIHNPNGRVVMFVIPEEGVRVPRLMGVPDFRKQEKKGS